MLIYVVFLYDANDCWLVQNDIGKKGEILLYRYRQLLNYPSIGKHSPFILVAHCKYCQLFSLTGKLDVLWPWSHVFELPKQSIARSVREGCVHQIAKQSGSSSDPAQTRDPSVPGTPFLVYTLSSRLPCLCRVRRGNGSLRDLMCIVLLYTLCKRMCPRLEHDVRENWQ